MPVITFNAFSFLQKKLKEKHIEYSNVTLTLKQGSSAKDLIRRVQLDSEEVEVVFINGKVASVDTIIQDKDRVALIPPGTPGPYRVLLGFKNKKLK
ncbi:MAG: MoaD/ThiS family protein [Desulfobacula sp.]|jgi:molybdopterin converting factor small subunit|uniref:MoaD/ThiS family protein n=1 Tax=Desulfobacula sp. TaxID=2593537 RepID=UPI001E01A8AE|nr:MoaD/ThiS family protein [Desulfobacula sp.]MBT3483933.1 MoaD/ThiS family protein [Desulfobacula sp.]MBT3803880.1 MoaD/ThiS family protein [Desulfobacula sp.]MBT4023825.1 MoaD/ThiS family protein [Desulfobacula sp.]MBT4197615.1 MoaD/ThiS family protein [Desulfobacula sp.]